MIYSRSTYTSLPTKAGVYMFYNKDDTVLYVGKANDLKSRVSSYFVQSGLLGEKTKALVSHIHHIRVTFVESELEALLLEAFYIKKYRPKYNIRLTDNKSYVRIRITMQDEYPRVLLARREDDKHSLYFGPYPNSRAVSLVLKTIRRVFPYQSVLNHPKRLCLYYHLGLCPCPPVFASAELKKEYRKNIRGIIRLLEGESKRIMKELEKERDVLSKAEAYEGALKIQKKIEALSIITTPFHKPFEYHVNPNLRVDLRQQELQQLMEVLNKEGMGLKKLERIECYDISNTQGTYATGSMVVLTHGEIDKSQYRKFKIQRDWEKQSKNVIPTEERVEGSRILRDSSATLRFARNDKRNNKPNDFAMMKEVLKRRLKHDEWPTPDLIVVDGGKGQVSSALIAMVDRGYMIPLIGLAKREETIIVPKAQDGVGSNIDRVSNYQHLLNYRFAENEKDKLKTIVVNEKHFTEISLAKNSPALHLIMRIRDEAHRFAITYHRKLRSKNALAS